MRRVFILALVLFGLLLPEAGGAQEENPRDRFLKAYKLFSEGQLEQAQTLFLETLDADFPLEDYSLYYLGIMASNRGELDNSRKYLSELKLRFPYSVWLHRAQLQLAKNALAEERVQDAVDILSKLRFDKKASKVISEEAHYLLAQVSQSQGEVTRAFSLYQELRSTAPLSPWAAAARKGIQQLRLKHPELFPLKSFEALWEEAELLMREKAYGEAEKIYGKLLDLGSVRNHRPRLLFGLARAYLAVRKRGEAIPVLTEIVRNYPQSPDASAALYRLAWILWNRNENERALSLFKQLIESYPNSSFLGVAHLASARIHESLGQREGAIALYIDTTKKFSESRTEEEAQWRLAWVYYGQADWNQAHATFKSIGERKDEGRFKTAALYWQGRTALKRGLTEDAKQVFLQILNGQEESYYNGPAARELEKMGVALPQNPPPTAESSGSLTPSINAEQAFHLTRARELEGLSLNQLAVAELDEMNRANDKGLPLRFLLMREYARNRAYARSVALAHQIPDLSEERSRHLYPLAYWTMIQQTANDHDLDPFLILALIRQESLFDPRARSSASALGLMQLLPSTATRVAKQLGKPLPSNEKLFEPEFNLTLGVAYLKELLRRYSNDLVKAIAAYNAGENAVARWEKEISADDEEEFIERIPYGETRLYVKLVLRNHRIYKSLYDNRR